MRGLAVGAMLAAAVACAAGCRAAGGGPAQLAAFSEHHVAVRITSTRDSAGQTWIAATFTPTDSGLHLYSKDLPKDGQGGIGRPTLVEIASAGWRAAGPLVASAEPESLRVAILGVTFPVYPDGPVTLRLPVTRSAGAGAGPDTLSLTYMACSARVCWPPVEDRRVAVRLP